MSRPLRQLLKNKAAIFGALLTLSFIVLGVFAPLIAPGNPGAIHLKEKLAPPSMEHLLGRDELGRDILGRLILGTRISLEVGFIVTSVSVIIGILIGSWSGTRGGIVDDLLMRLVDILMAFPGLLLAIALVAVLGAGIGNVILALCLMGWVGYARLTRGQALLIRELEYIEAARALGGGTQRIVFKHVIPNLISPIIIQATLGMAGAVVAEAGLSFLGLGAKPGTPSWGSMLHSGMDYLREAPHLTLFPGLAIALVVLGLNLLGDGLRDALDPKD